MIEYRFSDAPVTIRATARAADAQPSALFGYAATFDQETVIAGLFRERIAPGAFAESLKTVDVLVRFNHNEDRLLGRTSAGTATAREDARGLHYSVALNLSDPLAISVAAQVGRGDVTGSSFAFEMPNADDEEWIAPSSSRGLPLRILYRLRLIDVAPVVRPQYANTSVSGRAAIDGIAAREQARARLIVEAAKRRRL
jgi:uncharacterized protein